MKYRKKPIVIEAFQMTRERYRSNSKWPAWLHQAWQKPSTEAGALFRSAAEGVTTSDLFIQTLFIQTLEGTHKVSVDDWIIQGVAGELYPCKPDIFEKTYEAVYDAKKPWTQMGEGAMW